VDQHPQQRDQRPAYSNEDERYRWMVANMRSFTTPAVITMILYFVFWLPGLIVNLVYLNEARALQRQTGREPDGKGCLVALLVVMGGLGLIGICVWVAIIVGFLSS
jgi:hypothetical protein